MYKKIRTIIMTLLLIAILLSSTLVANAGLYRVGREQMQQAPSQPDDPEKYAVIVVSRYFGSWNGGILKILSNLTAVCEHVQQYYTWYLNDAARIYKMLNQTNGYSEENIILMVKKPQDVSLPLLNFYYNFD